DVPTRSEAAQKSSNIIHNAFTDVAKSSKKILPGLEGAWATTPDPQTLEDGTKDLFQGAIPMYTESGKFLEDLEQYKAHYNPDHHCEVFDAELQDPLLRDTYIGLPPLPLRHIEASYNPSENSDSDDKGGRIRFSVWPKCIENCSASLSLRLNIDTMAGAKVAICVTSGMCMRSHVVTGVKTFGSPPREHKYINVVMHNQDWERWAAFMCLCFGQQLLYANITDLAIQFGTMMSKTDDANASSVIDGSIHPDLMSPIKSTTASPSKPRYDHPVKYALAFQDTVPVYDARNRDFDFDDNLADINNLPRWKGEVPIGSFVVNAWPAQSRACILQFALDNGLWHSKKAIDSNATAYYKYMNCDTSN
ncbi:hypothetical protein B0H13DRAFT_1914816, partial [Mycena leptocephala]